MTASSAIIRLDGVKLNCEVRSSHDSCFSTAASHDFCGGDTQISTYSASHDFCGRLAEQHGKSEKGKQRQSQKGLELYNDQLGRVRAGKSTVVDTRAAQAAKEQGQTN